VSDIFISYAREDRERVKTIAKALAASGWTVWWDPEIPLGKVYRDVIQEALDAARCIVVVWSKASIRSNWVIEEAEEGHRRNILVPILIDRELTIPLGLRSLQTADLTRRSQIAGSRVFGDVTANITRILDKPHADPQKPPPRKPLRGLRRATDDNATEKPERKRKKREVPAAEVSDMEELPDLQAVALQGRWKEQVVVPQATIVLSRAGGPARVEVPESRFGRFVSFSRAYSWVDGSFFAEKRVTAIVGVSVEKVSVLGELNIGRLLFTMVYGRGLTDAPQLRITEVAVDGLSLGGKSVSIEYEPDPVGNLLVSRQREVTRGSLNASLVRRINVAGSTVMGNAIRTMTLGDIRFFRTIVSTGSRRITGLEIVKDNEHRLSLCSVAVRED
jgi:hypothetical protein